MRSFRQVPNELWLDIFKDLSQDSIKTLSLTCEKFRDISRPFLFAHFDFHPYAVGNWETILLPPDIMVYRALERLDFWTSDDIAPYIRSCKITPWQSHSSMWYQDGPVWARCHFSVTDSPHILLVPFLERLRKCTSLQSLHIEGVYFTQSTAAALCRAPALADIQLVRCNVAAREFMDAPSGPHLGVSRFSLCDFSTGDSLSRWIPLLSPDRLDELELRGDPRLFGENIAAIPVFPLVRRLTTTLDYADPTMAYDFSILSKFPAVEIFSTEVSIIHYGIVRPHFPVLPSTVLPVLRQYRGPVELMALFLPRSTLTHLAILSCSPRAFRAQLNGIQGLSSILSLDVSFSGGFGTDTIRSIRLSFPRLKELHVRVVCDVESGDPNIHHMVAGAFIELGDPTVLPTGLERLAFRCAVKNTRTGDVGADSLANRLRSIEVPKFNDLRDALVGNYPALRTFWLESHNFVFRWCKSLHGVEEGIATTRSDAQEMREGFDAFWENR